MFIQKTAFGFALFAVFVSNANAAFPTVESIGTKAFSSDSTTHNVDMPSTVTTDDLLVLLFVCQGTPTVTTPSGWAQQSNLGFTFGTFTVYAKVAAGTEGGTTVNVATSAAEAAAATVYRITGWHGTLATGLESAFSGIGNGTSADPPSLDPTNWDVEDTMWIAAVAAADDDVTVTGFPGGYSGANQVASGAGENAGCEVATAWIQSAVASQNPGAFTLASSETFISATLAIRPAASGGDGGGGAAAIDPREPPYNAVPMHINSTTDNTAAFQAILDDLDDFDRRGVIDLQGMRWRINSRLVSDPKTGLKIVGGGGAGQIRDFDEYESAGIAGLGGPMGMLIFGGLPVSATCDTTSTTDAMSSTIVLNEDVVSSNDEFNGYIVSFETGALAGYKRIISDSATGTLDSLTVQNPPLPVAPSETDQIRIRDVMLEYRGQGLRIDSVGFCGAILDIDGDFGRALDDERAGAAIYLNKTESLGTGKILADHLWTNHCDTAIWAGDDSTAMNCDESTLNFWNAWLCERGLALVGTNAVDWNINHARAYGSSEGLIFLGEDGGGKVRARNVSMIGDAHADYLVIEGDTSPGSYMVYTSGMTCDSQWQGETTNQLVRMINDDGNDSEIQGTTMVFNAVHFNGPTTGSPNEHELFTLRGESHLTIQNSTQVPMNSISAITDGISSAGRPTVHLLDSGMLHNRLPLGALIAGADANFICRGCWSSGNAAGERRLFPDFSNIAHEDLGFWPPILVTAMESPVTVYHLDEESGTAVNDGFASNDGTSANCTVIRGRFGYTDIPDAHPTAPVAPRDDYALSFGADDNDALIASGITDTSIVNADFAISLYVRRSSVPTGSSEIICGTANNTMSTGFLLEALTTSGFPRLTMHDGSDQLQVTGSTNICNGDWHHIVISVDRGSNMVLYVNETDVQTVGASALNNISTGAAILFGNGPADMDANQWEGDIDEICFDDRFFSTTFVRLIHVPWLD